MQTWAARKGAAYLSQKLHTKVSIGSLYLEPFTSVVLKDFYVLDQKKDTLVNMSKLTVDINAFSLFRSIKQRTIDLSLVKLDNTSVYLKTYKDSISNARFIINFFSSPDTSKSTGKPWNVIFGKVAVNNLHFRYKNYLVDTLINGVNFDDVDVKKFSTVIDSMDVIHHLFKGYIHNLTLHEKSGAYIKNLTADATVDTNLILTKHLFLQTANSMVKDYFRMKFKSFDDFTDIEDKVMMDADFKSSRVSSKDIAFFTSGLERVRFDLGVDGKIHGMVRHLTAKNLLITGGQATYIRGDFSLRGLPDWDNTFLELKFNQLSTNKKDLDYLYSNFTGTNGAKVPDIISKFGNIDFTGRFTGLQNDFVAFGTFKTKLGRFDPDINLKIDKKGVPAYSGKISTSNFDLGDLLDNDAIGRTTLSANVKGSGDELKNLTENLDAQIGYINYNDYDYNNLNVKGTFIKKIANAKISINDKNVKLNLVGTVDLNPALTAYNFTADIKDAHLHTLNLLKDTITLTTVLKTKFSGNSLENLQGHIELAPIRIIDPRNNYLVDSIDLSAHGKGDTRIVALKSDIAEANIHGSFDLATLPSYFKQIVKKYIPSLKIASVTPKPQHFEFNLALKNMRPILAFIDPDLKIPDQGTFVGEFDSSNETATLNGYVKTIQYGTTVFHDLILDENTTNGQLGLNISLSKINITDSLFIKNVDISNALRKDSLNFNIKLADKDATNQLDLYGLVEFGRDTTAKLKLLPSDVILEHQYWKLTDQVRIKFLDGKTEIDGFQLSNGLQKVRINGLISSNPEDKLKLEFEKFNMNTFDQLTKVSGVALKGSLNGNVTFSSISNTPGIDAHLNIDSLNMNKTLVGDVKIESTLGNDRKEADVKMRINNNGTETMNITGAYKLTKEAEANALDFKVKMDRVQAVIFDPFIRDLVSDPKGTVSSDLSLTGPISKPQMNGTVTLDNTSVTVNYLKATFTVSDKLTVTNSVIDVDGMVLKDAHGGTGEVKGKVDLNDLNNPDIEATVTAKNLLALNTTFKDNHIYYGKAYGTGTFSFNGPVNTMDINIKARTLAGTVFNIPLNTSTTAGDYDFIRFVSHKDSNKEIAPKNAFDGVTLNLDLTVDERTIVKITTDYGVLEGSGTTNNLNLNINSLGDFNMYGDFLISTGKFEFTAKNFISKNFTVNQGGTIRWTGDPANADINLNAIYEVRTDISPLYQAAGLQSPKGAENVLVQAELIITKSLLHPTIDFDFNFPTDPSIKDDLGTYLTDYNNRSQQALSIIVRRNFASGTPSNLTNQVFSTAGEAVSEFAFNKLNSFISQSNIKNFDLNLRSFNDASASLRLFNSRLVFNGSLFTTTGSNDLFNSTTQNNLFNSNFNSLTKDFEAQYLLRKSGDLTAKYSYRVLNTTTLNTIDQLSVQYVNGVGLTYQRDFDTFGEFFRNLFRKSTGNKSKNKIPTPIPANKDTPTLTEPSSGSNTSEKSEGDDN
ncbi:translocation/assembly module TamB domain-containing protein [Mucilaginibacter sp.]